MGALPFEEKGSGGEVEGKEGGKTVVEVSANSKQDLTSLGLGM